uniref:SWI/SNF-like complex subunit BAF250 C-terminal domain-containing protein n=1 Tax=Panagrolaimus sp. PS1159 TaxID=55785 RepID=A0AC35GH78_9BILA
MFHVPVSLRSFTELCLAWSNVIRGISFIPGNQKTLMKNNCLLRIIGKILLLCMPSEETLIKLDYEKTDDIRAFLKDVINQLRDDAFTALSFIAGPQLDLFELDSGISYPIFSALLLWTVSNSNSSRDPLVQDGTISSRDYCLEIIAKMSVNEQNVDLLLSAGSDQIIERFVIIVSELLHVGEDTHIREFALVIMAAVCDGSELACICAALKTNIVKTVLTFLEYAVNTKGFDYRNDEELIGTTIGMLNKAVSLLESMVQYEICRKPFIMNIYKLVNLTSSPYMDPQLITRLDAIIHIVHPGYDLRNRLSEARNFVIPKL